MKNDKKAEGASPLNPSRRQMLAATATALFLRPGISEAATPLSRKDSFFGVHFDLHPTPEDQALGRDVTEGMIEGLLRAVKPDFVQYDSKGHPGYLGFPSKTGMSAPHIVRDSLEIWRRVTSRLGVALYNHFSGVLDGLAVTKHPEWARVGPDGKGSNGETSLFSDYERDLMIPELEEVATHYSLNGSWVDGDCWAVEPDYSERSLAEFRAQTHLDKAPKGPGDPGWNEFLELQREAFRRYVSAYVAALHKASPGFQITSNWMYSTFVPEEPTVALDYLSGDIADQAPVRRARTEARYFAAADKPWDLMSWGFEYAPHFGDVSDKSAVALEQEAAIVIAQGGAYQVYYTPTRTGAIDDRIVHVISEVAGFCRARQALSHRSDSIPEAAILFSRRSLYRDSTRVFGPWGQALAPAEGAVDALIACGYSTDILPDWKDAATMARYPMLVVPDWGDLGEDIASRVVEYVNSGGHLLLCGAANSQLFADRFGLRFSTQQTNHGYYAADEDGFASIEGQWRVIEAEPSTIIGSAYRTQNSKGESIPMGVRLKHGKGTAVVCPGPLMTEYAIGRTPILRETIRTLAAALRPPAVSIDAKFSALEIVLRHKEGDVLLHLINLENAPVTGEFRHPGYVPPTGPFTIAVRLRSSPSRVTLEPGRTTLAGNFAEGVWRGSIPEVAIHAIIRFEAAAR
jgi:hypothetical protein